MNLTLSKASSWAKLIASALTICTVLVGLVVFISRKADGSEVEKLKAKVAQHDTDDQWIKQGLDELKQGQKDINDKFDQYLLRHK